MKKCPYCAEEIQNGAIVCRYCYKTVKHFLFRRILRYVIIAVLTAALVGYGPRLKSDFANYKRAVRAFFTEIGDIMTSLKEGLKDMIKGMAVLKERLGEAERLIKGEADDTPYKQGGQ